jgi:hypothetical protein
MRFFDEHSVLGMCLKTLWVFGEDIECDGFQPYSYYGHLKIFYISTY